jgi:asparagine synthase (glutamine-hydrolysing)
MDVSGAVELHVNRRAREMAPVRLTGNYGSEILRSNVAFRPGRLDLDLFTPEFQKLLQEAEATYREEAKGHRLSFIVFKQVPWHHYSRLSLEQSQLTVRSPFLDNDLVALAYQVPPELATSPLPLLQLIAEGNPLLETVPTDRALRRRPAPLFSRVGQAFQEFTAKAEYAYDYGMPDWAARTDRVFKPLHLEKLFLGRHKFYHFRVWYRDQLASSVKEVLLDGQSLAGSHLNLREARERVTGHLDGKCNFTLGIHKILGTELLQRSLFLN